MSEGAYQGQQIFRSEKRKRGRFAQIDNALLQHPKLSAAAKAVLNVALSWRSRDPLVAATFRTALAETNYAIKKAHSELVRFGYAHFRKFQDDLGRWKSAYDYFEDPELNEAYVNAKCRETDVLVSDVGKPFDNKNTIDACIEECAEHFGYTIDDWFARLEEAGCGPKWSGEKIRALCPNHNDTNPSLTVSKGKKVDVIVKCHARCNFDEIQSRLFPPRDIPQTVYTYCNEVGKPVHRVRRRNGKSFSVECFDGKTWHKGLKKSADVRYPYKLPEVIRAIKAEREIWIVEGEKDVETLRSKGFVATCNLFGAGNWRFDLSKWFKRATVVIVADKDTAGYDHAKKVLDHLIFEAKDIRVVQAAGGPEINDATDHFDAGYGPWDFVEIREL